MPFKSKQDRAEYMRQYRKDHPDKIKAINKKYYIKTSADNTETNTPHNEKEQQNENELTLTPTPTHNEKEQQQQHELTPTQTYINDTPHFNISFYKWSINISLINKDIINFNISNLKNRTYENIKIYQHRPYTPQPFINNNKISKLPHIIYNGLNEPMKIKDNERNYTINKDENNKYYYKKNRNSIIYINELN